MAKFQRVLDALAPAWKAVLGFLTPGAVIIGSALLETSDGGSVITTAEWGTAIVAMIVSGGAVYAVPNRVRTPTVAGHTAALTRRAHGQHDDNLRA